LYPKEEKKPMTEGKGTDASFAGSERCPGVYLEGEATARRTD
jgi:hypothetical protein